MAKRKNIEDAIQKEFIRWFKENYPSIDIFATRNEDSYRRSKELEIGLPDIIIRFPVDDIRHIFYLEIKTKKGRLSPSQIEWAKKPLMSNEHYAVAYGLEECRDSVIKLFHKIN